MPNYKQKGTKNMDRSDRNSEKCINYRKKKFN